MFFPQMRVVMFCRYNKRSDSFWCVCNEVANVPISFTMYSHVTMKDPFNLKLRSLAKEFDTFEY